MSTASKTRPENSRAPSLQTSLASEPTRRRLVEVESTTGRKPRAVDRLRDWEYLERQNHRVICAWGRYFHEWGDIIAVHRHVWEAAECVRRLRQRLVQFPGADANLDQPVSSRLECLANTVLDAPTHEDAIDGLYGLFSRAMTASYANYAEGAHPVHDAPTVELINEVMTIRESFRLWMRDYRRRHKHTTDPRYAAAIEQALSDCDDLLLPLIPTSDDPAKPVGTRIDFQLPRHPALPVGARGDQDLMPYIKADFQTSPETRRLFWCIGYMREITLAMDQLCWVWDTPYMPWEFHHDVSRHLWDESRHGDSGYSRMLDFGIGIEEVGIHYDDSHDPWDARVPARPSAAARVPGAFPAAGAMTPRTAAEMYETLWSCGMLAETGHFPVKREAYDDFKAGGDLESAEMMLFDIIDEQTHVQYAHRWLPILAKFAGVEMEHQSYKERAAACRKELFERSLESARQARSLPRDESDPVFALYQRLLRQMRSVLPLSNAGDHTPRTMLPQ